MLVTALAAPSRAEAAFHTTIRAAVFDGQVIYGNVTPALVPTQLRGLVVAVLGLTNAYKMKTHIQFSNRPVARRQIEAAMTPQVTSANTPPPCFVRSEWHL